VMTVQDVEGPTLRLVDLVRTRYVFPDVAEKICGVIVRGLESGEYRQADSYAKLAEMLTADLQSTNQDRHLAVRVNPDLVKTILRSQGSERLQDEPEREDCGFEAIENLDGDIGYLKLSEFADTKYAGDAAVAAMQRLAGSRGLIIDLRRNGGGSPKMVQLLTTYLFGHEPVHLNNFYMRETDSLDQFWILPYVPGKRLTDAFVYVLTSDYTFSAAEEFCFNLQNLKRATVIGEVTGGGAHPGDDHVLNGDLCVFIPHGRAINPISGTNWEGVGVKPDIEVPADEAFDVAYRMARNQ
jgi:C-terminal processing protease CtpA/Prc